MVVVGLTVVCCWCRAVGVGCCLDPGDGIFAFVARVVGVVAVVHGGVAGGW